MQESNLLKSTVAHDPITIRISIVIPTCARQMSAVRLLNELNSAGIGNRADVEVIVVQNDKEPSVDFAEQITAAGAKCMHQPKKGQAAALNIGIVRAKGDLIVTIDDDVRVVDSGWLDQLVCHFEDQHVAYVAGNVLASELTTPAQKAWEAKGGLSKGLKLKRFDSSFFNMKSFRGLPLRFVACGANAALRKDVLERVGLYNELFGVGSYVGHSQSHEICYKILREGFTAVYDPTAILEHDHPRDWASLRRRMYNYGIGDTAVQMHFFITYFDFRGLREALFGRQFYLFGNLLRRIRGKYSLPVSLILCSMIGAALGPLVYIVAVGRNKLNNHLSSIM